MYDWLLSKRSLVKIQVLIRGFLLYYMRTMYIQYRYVTVQLSIESRMSQQKKEKNSSEDTSPCSLAS